MSLFLRPQWINAVTQHSPHLHPKCLHLEGYDIYVSEWQYWGIKTWNVYGEFRHHSEKKLDQLFQQAKLEHVCVVESHFNMSRWQCAEILERTGCRITMTFGTYLIDLKSSENELWTGLHSKHRNVIRNAVKNGVEIRDELDISAFKVLLDHAYAKGGKKNTFHLPYLQSLLHSLGNNLLMAGAYYQGELQAGILVPYDSERGYYLHGATSQKCIPGASNLLHWEVIKKLKMMGVQAYDLGGARQETDDPRLQGIFRFKKRFGGTFVPCYYWEKVLNPSVYTMYHVLQNGKKVIKNVFARHD